MKRDTQLIKKILLYVRQRANGDPIPFPSFDGYDQRFVDYNVRLCVEAGFVNLHSGPTSNLMDNVDEIASLTWLGHEQLEHWPCK